MRSKIGKVSWKGEGKFIACKGGNHETDREGKGEGDANSWLQVDYQFISI